MHTKFLKKIVVHCHHEDVDGVEPAGGTRVLASMTIEQSKNDTTEFTNACRDLLIAARDRGCAKSLNLLTLELEDVTRRIAKVVIAGRREAKEQFADESLSLVFAPYLVFERKAIKTEERPPRIFRFDPDEYVYELWCRKVLRNLLRSKIRKVNLEQTVADFPSIEDGGPADYLQLATEFSFEDLSVLHIWPAEERLMLLCLSGLFVKLQKSHLDVFVVAAAEALDLRFPDPFPTRLLLDEEDPSSRMSLVAELFRVKINTMSARWMRKKHLLRELTVVRDCEPGENSTTNKT